MSLSIGGVEKGTGINLYKKSLYAPNRDIVESFKERYGEKSEAYL